MVKWMVDARRVYRRNADGEGVVCVNGPIITVDLHGLMQADAYRSWPRHDQCYGHWLREEQLEQGYRLGCQVDAKDEALEVEIG